MIQKLKKLYKKIENNLIDYILLFAFKIIKITL